MIDSLTLQNFQAHEKTHIKFSPGINVIVGDNDNGKSSIARGLYWVFHNKPSGDEFIRWGKSKCSVSVSVNNKKVKREKGPNYNKYVIDGQGFNAVRSDVPGELENIARITDTNIQMEDDPQFLLSSNPGEVARKLNDVVGLNQIDESIQYPNKIIRQMNTSINHIQKDIQEKQRQHDKLKDIEKVEKKNEKLDKLIGQKEAYDSQIEDIESIIEDLEEQQQILDQQAIIKKLSKMLNELFETSNKLHATNENIKDINRSIKTLKTNKRRIKKLQPIENLSSSITELQNVSKEVSDIRSHQINLAKSMKQINKNNKQVNSLQSELKELRKEFKREQRKLKVCPTCERPFEL